MKTKMVVADSYQLGKMGAEFSKDLKGELLRSSQVVTREWAEQMNESHKVAGKWYEIDEDATKEYYDSKGKSKVANAVVVEEDNDLNAEYKSLFGRNPRSDWSTEQIQSKIDSKLSK